MIEPIFEANFVDVSYGFRPKRDAKQATEKVKKSLYKNWYVVDADIQGYFDNINHEILLSLLKRRISDRRILKLCRLWLQAGVIENGEYSKTEIGSPQGGVISPLLANIYLHVLDSYWNNHEGLGEIVRYADDAVIICRTKKDAELAYSHLRYVMEKLKLTLNPKKTKIVDMKHESFDFLGLLSNVMLNELDKELERRGHRFVRYADDCMIFCKSRKSAERTLENILPYIEGKLFLKVNRKKTEVTYISKVKYLGYSFYRYKGKCRFRVHPKSVAKMKNKIRELTDRNNGMSNVKREEKYQQFVRGWVNYFKLADIKALLKATDEWARRRIRAVYWKQWKRIKTKYRMLKALGCEHWRAKELACSRKGYWRMAKVLNQIFSNKIIAKLGYTSMLDYYSIVYEN